MMTEAKTASAGRLVYVVNVSWFFLSHRLALARAARDAGYDVHVATRVASPGDAARIGEAGLILHDLPIGRGDTGPLYDLRTLWSLAVLFRRLRPDLVHLVTMKPIVFGGIAARLTGVPGVVVAIAGLGTGFAARGAASRLRRRMLGALLRLAIPRAGSRVIFQNQEDMQHLVDQRVVPASSARLIRGSGVDPDEFPAQPAPPPPIRVLLPARMLREKGITVFVEAARMLRARHPAARFLLAGDLDSANPGALTRGELEALAGDGIVEWLGHVADMPSLLASCHVVCLPTWYGEGVPKALIEGAAIARPLVTTDIAGCRDICEHGVNGLLVPPRDPRALAAALDRLLSDESLRKSMGAASRERVLDRFALRQVVAATLRVYDELRVRR